MTSRYLLALTTFFLACGPGTDDSASTEASTSGATTTAVTTAMTTAMTTAPTTTASSTAADETGAATTGAVPMAAECAQDSDCQLIDNCCECDAKPKDAEVAACEGNCFVSTCTGRNLENVRVACRSGVCEFADEDCSEGPVTCEAVKPSCPEGTRVTVQDDCWGPCVHPRYCVDQACPPDGCGAGWTCVTHQATASDCVVIPFACAGAIGCECAAPFTDEICAGACVEEMGGINCQDGG